MNNYGGIVRDIRNAKGLTLKEVAGNGISVSQLSSFETGKSNLTLDKFFVVLENMGVSVEEFEHAAHGYRFNPFDQLLKKTTKLFNDGNIQGLRKLINDQKKNSFSGVRHELTIIMIKNQLAEIDEYTRLREEEKNKVMDYLINVREWTHFELVLYSNTMRTLSTDDLVDITQDILSRAMYYQEIRRNRHLMTTIVLNSMIVMVDRKELTRARGFEKILHQQQIDEANLFDKNLLLFATGVLEFYEGEKDSGKRKMKQAIEILNTLESYRFAERYQTDYDKIIMGD